MTHPRLVPLIDELMRRAARGMILDPDRVHRALEALGHPERGRSYVHVTGTNGKGSTSAMVEAIAREAGVRTGLYTSPHLCRWAERIRVDGEAIGDEVFAASLERALEAAPEATFFEALTLAAFVAFEALSVPLVVLEVGIGGRLDATNVVEDKVGTAITTVGLEHTALLGGTLASIAREKAGIFRRGVPVVLGPLEDEALGAALEAADAVGAGPILRLARPGEVASSSGKTTVFEARALPEGRARIELPGARVEAKLALGGAHQVDNAAVAAALALVSLKSPGVSSALPGILARGIASARWPGRLERIEKEGRTVLLDCAHNPHGVTALASHLRAEGFDPARVILVFGALADKDWPSMLDMLAPFADRRVYASPKGRPAASLVELAARFPGEMAPEGPEAASRALSMAGPGDVVVVTGSLYLIGEIRGSLLGIECDPLVAF